jgi:ribosomal protein L34
VSVDEDLKLLEVKLNQLKLDYERYFLGTRPRAPSLLRGEVQKLVAYYSNVPIQNTALRFRFSTLCSRYQAFKRRWDETLRQIEDGSYQRHRFRAGLHQRDAPPSARSADDLYGTYVEARRSCGQDVSGLTRERLEAILTRERATLARRYGDVGFEFRVVVDKGKAVLKARRAAG